MQLGMSSSMAGETRLKDSSGAAGILNGFLRITGLLGCSAWAKVGCFWWMTRWLNCFWQADWVLGCPLWATVWLDCSLWVDWILNCPLWATEWLDCSLWADWILNVFFRNRAGLGETSFISVRFSWFWSFPDLLGLLRRQELFFFLNSAINFNRGWTTVSKTKRKKHNQCIIPKIGINNMTTEPG